MIKQTHVIIGAGPAALSAAAAIRQTGCQDGITIITKESCAPYSPAALPYLFDGEMTEQVLFSKGNEALHALKIEYMNGVEAIALDPQEKMLTLSNGETVEYGKLLVATGAHPTITAIDGLSADDVHVLRTFGDYLALKDKGKRVAIYGAGLVAVELAEKLAHTGVKTAVIARSRLLRKYFNVKLAEQVEKTLSAHGVAVYSGSPVASVCVGKESTYTIALENGTVVEADVFVSAIGVSANLPFPIIKTEAGGILATADMRTNLPDVYTAGDVAAPPAFFSGMSEICPILTEALEQGRIAGLNMAGEKAQYRGSLTANMLRCFDDYLFSVGITDAAAKGVEVFEKSEPKASFRLFVKNDCVVGVEAWNHPEFNAGVFRYLIYEGVPISNAMDAMMKDPGRTAKWLMAEHRKARATALISTR